MTNTHSHDDHTGGNAAHRDEDTIIIPGHGALTDRAGLADDRHVLRTGQSRMRALVAEGMNEEEVLAANPLEGFESRSWSFIRRERVVRTLYRDLTGG